MRTHVTARNLLVAMACAASLGGCATATCDPNSAGFVGGLGNAMSGCYVATENRQRATLAQERIRMEAAMADARTSQARAEDAQFRAMNVAAQLANVSQSNAELRRRLEQARARRDTDQASVQAAQEQLDRLERERQSAPANSQALEQLHREQSTLDRLMTQL